MSGAVVRGGGRKQEKIYNATVVVVSCVPRLSSPDWLVSPLGEGGGGGNIMANCGFCELEDPALIRIV